MEYKEYIFKGILRRSGTHAFCTNANSNFFLTCLVLASISLNAIFAELCIYVSSLHSENVNAYCLHIAEDDGEVDTDFPPLDSSEPIHKFGFSTLALVEKYSSPGLASRQSLFVRM